MIGSLTTRGLLFLASALAALTLLATASSAAAAPSFGVQYHAMWNDYTSSERARVLDKMRAAGVDWLRIDVGWISFQDTNGEQYASWAVDRLDAIVAEANARGFEILLMVWGTPWWANGDKSREVPPTNADDYGKFVGWLADRYRGKVKAYEIWNEPNHAEFFAGTAAQYVDLLRAAYPRVHAADPSALVVLGAPAYNDAGWIGNVYAAGARDFFDVAATHPYMSPANLAPETDNGTMWTMASLASVIDVMERYGDGSKPIWLTEFGWSSHANTSSTPNWMLGVTEEQQGDYAVRAMEYMASRFPTVTNMIWYNERNRASGNLQIDNYGLLTRDFADKPVIERLQAYLTGSTPVSEPSTPVSAPEITTVSLPGGKVGTAYSTSLGVEGGAAPYGWSVASGALPGGLTLASGGTLSGTPTQAGTFAFALRVTDAGGQTDTASYSLTVEPTVRLDLYGSFSSPRVRVRRGTTTTTTSFRVYATGAAIAGTAVRFSLVDGLGNVVSQQTKSIGRISAGRSTSVSLSYTGPYRGYTIVAEIDPAGLLPETNESNNRASARIP